MANKKRAEKAHLQTAKQQRDAQVRELVKTNTTLELFLRALTQLYPMDRMAPGITLAALAPDCDGATSYYAAVNRYDLDGQASPTNPGRKQTLVSVKAPTLQMAILELAATWQGKTSDAVAFAGVKVRRLGKVVNQKGQS